MSSGKGSVCFSTGSDSPVSVDSSIAQVAGVGEAHVGRDLVAGLQDDDVAGHQFGGRQAQPLAVAHAPWLRRSWPRDRASMALTALASCR